MRSVRRHSLCRLVLLGWVLFAPALLRSALVLDEFLAANTRGVQDEDGDYSDWVELQNEGSDTVNLSGWSLTTSPEGGRDQRWLFPATNVPPGGLLLVYASGKDRRAPGGPLHTDFKLNREGESLVLYGPDENPAPGSFLRPFPPQLENVSYGLGRRGIDEELINTGAPHYSWVPSSGRDEGRWQSPGFSMEGWSGGEGGVGYDTRPVGELTLHSLIQDDLRARLFSRNPGVYVRVPFVVPTPLELEGLTLQMWFTDGFSAFLNGVEVLSYSRPPDLAWDSAAVVARDPEQALRPLTWSLSREAVRLLQPGTNWLALHGFNQLSTAPHFLLRPRLVGSRSTSAQEEQRYFPVPTPGDFNGVGSSTLGPVLSKLSEPPRYLEPARAIPVSVQVAPSFRPVKAVELRYRVMFGNEEIVAMKDDGRSGDQMPRDGVYGGVIPAGRIQPGQMLRWRVVATDVQDQIATLPVWDQAAGSSAYVGSVAATNLASELPVFDWFIEERNLAAAYTRSGTRCSVYYDGELYDNVEVRLRGENSVTWDKKSLKFDFNPDHRFRQARDLARVDEINLNSTWSDKSYIRQVLSWEMYRDAGAAYCRSFPLRIQQNGGFYSVAVFVEQPDAEMLARNGLDPRGSLYKINNALESAEGAEKLLPRDGELGPLREFVDGISASNPRRVSFLFDHLDLPAVINYLAATVLIHDNDCTAKNYFLYQDSAGSGEWQMLPWDKDLTFGRNFRSRAGLSDEIWADFDHTNSIGSDHPFASPSHPLFMDQEHQKENGQWNRLTDALYAIPIVREMYLCRLRSLMDQLLQSNEVPFAERRLERRLDDLLHQMEPDTLLDQARWGYPTYGVPQSMGKAVQVIQSEYLQPRRHHLFVTHNVTNASIVPDSARIPESAPPGASVQFGVVQRAPLSGNPEEQYIELFNPNPFTLDFSGWTLHGAVSHTLRPGTVLPAATLLYLTPNRRAFRARELSPRGGMGLFVQGDYQGRLDSRPGFLELREGARVVVRVELPDGRSARQRSLQLVRIMYQPGVSQGERFERNENLEYVELRNLGTEPLDLAGVRFTEGIRFEFPPHRIQELPATVDPDDPARSVLLVKNRASFVAHYGLEPRIAGEYLGSLDNQGERLRLEEPNGEVLFDFVYHPDWYPVTQGLGFALARRPEVDSSLVGPENSAAWTVGPWEALPGPLPMAGRARPLPRVTINEVKPSGVDASDEEAIELVSEERVDVGGWFLSDDFQQPRKFRIPPGTRLAPGEFLVFGSRQFGVPADGYPGFRLRREGEEVHLFSAGADGGLTGFHYGVRFPSSPPGGAIARLPIGDTEEQWVVVPVATLGATNRLPSSASVFISEIHYHAPEGRGGVPHEEVEFVELRNPLPQPLLAFDPLSPTNTWSIDGEVQFSFPPQFVFPPASEVVVVNFNPAEHPELAAQFRRIYGLPLKLPLLGPWHGSLQKAGGRLALRGPGASGRDFGLTTVMDEARYMPGNPWNPLADGQGPSLSRKSAELPGTDPASWVATAPNPGHIYDPTILPRILIHPGDRTFDGYSDVTLGVLAGPDPFLRYQWRLDGKPIAGAEESVYQLRSAPPSRSGVYDVVVMARGGVVVSGSGRVEIRQPPLIYLHPAPPPIPVIGSNYVLRVGALPASGGLRFQWYFNQRPLPGETREELRLNSLSPEMAGSYQVSVDSGFAKVLSQPAGVVPLYPPRVLASPESQMVNVGERIYLRVVATGTPPIAYFWRKNGLYLKGENRTELMIPNAKLGDAGVYSVVVSNVTTPRLIPPLERANVLVLSDTDGDGMPDIWELTHEFRSDRPEDADQDADLDGANNLAEYRAGTNPRDPTDFLKVDRFVRSDLLSGSGLLSFSSISNRPYVLQTTLLLGEGWTSWLRFPSLTTNSRVNVPVPFDATPTRHFRLLIPGVGDPIE